MDFTESEQTNGAMNRTNILPYDGLAYLVDDTGGKFEWPEITSNLAKTIPWRIETACDNEAGLGDCIASLSLGATRRFQFRH
jgi:hypothetical protein